MSDAYFVTGGALKLKGKGLPPKKKKKSKKVIEKQNDNLLNAINQDLERAELMIPADPRTDAEKKFDEIQRKRLAEHAKKFAEKSHREKIIELNTKLDQMSEHFDIPKVGPG